MNRIIKFRALDPKEGWYYFTLKEVMTGKKNFTDEDWTVVEFTGLKDKNGKDIYEGDTIAFEGIGSSNTVIFHNGFFGVDLFGIKVGAELRHLNDSDKWEVIGNIYEGS